jgi:hypothetical protein
MSPRYPNIRVGLYLENKSLEKVLKESNYSVEQFGGYGSSMGTIH